MFNRTILPVITFIILSTGSFAQQWAPPGAIWYYSFQSFWSEGYVMIEAAGDTSIAGQDYRVLVKTLHAYNHITGTYSHGEIGREYTFYEDNKVFIRRNNVDYTLYDFGAQEGDEWTIPYTYGVDTICDSTGTVRCDLADTSSLNGYVLNIFIVNPVEGSHWGFGGQAELIQYIGNTSDYFLPNITEECPVADLFEGGTFRCYHDEVLGWYTKVPVGECDLITGIEEPAAVEEMLVFPNPCSGSAHLHFIFHVSHFTSIDLYSIDGRKIKRLMNEVTLPGTHEIAVDVSNLTAGVYFIQVQTGDKVAVRKLVVSD